jgi:hypothetical protein
MKPVCQGNQNATPELNPASMYLGFHNPLKLHPETN